jgi:hypothetical protein
MMKYIIIKEFVMKNLEKLIGLIAIAAVIGFMAACEPENTTKDNEEIEATTDGRLTITGLSAFEGKEIYAQESLNQVTNSYRNDNALGAYDRATNDYNPNEGDSGSLNYYPAVVTGGQVVLKVFMNKGWQRGNGKEGGFQSYTGNDQNMRFDVYIDADKITGGYEGYVAVNFTNGVGTGAFVASP